MQQKVIKIGNSLGLILPKHIIKDFSIKFGQALYVDTYKSEKSIVLRLTKNKAQGVTPEFIKYLDQFMKRHSEALSELAKR